MLSKSELLTIKEEVSESAHTFRSFSFYVSVFGYSEDTVGVKGKSILDIGAGDSNFAELANQRGAKLVVSLDPAYNELAPPKHNKGKAVASFAQVLPFGNETFDEVVACWSIYWIKTGLKDAFSEMVRVTKIGGEIKIYPVEVKHFLDELDLPAQINTSSISTNMRDIRDVAYILRIRKDDLKEDRWKEVIDSVVENINFGPLAEPARDHKNPRICNTLFSPTCLKKIPLSQK